MTGSAAFSTHMTGWGVGLEPLGVEHADELWPTVEAATFQHWVTLQPAGPEPAHFADFLAETVRQEHAVSYLVRDLTAPGSPAVGKTSFMDIRAGHRGCEIGMTWLAPSARGTHVNPAIKLLMLEDAFENARLLRVQLKCDARNTVSRRAIARLGAVEEGTLRRHMIQPNGYVRDTVMFSITDLDWPAVREGLTERLRAL
ncbi:MAG: GNAT family N-acetyltransferase [Fimbriimonadaceae bacterium]|nr:GNAT family N-acetyltransferase [Fimbriimonadaceae bacterium]